MTIKNEYIPPQVESAFDTAKSWIKDLRVGSVVGSVASKPSTVAPLVKGLGLVAIGVAAGAALAYFLDPENGEDRRRMAKEKGLDMTEGLRQKAQDFSEKVQDQYQSAKSAFTATAKEAAQTAESQTPDLH